MKVRKTLRFVTVVEYDTECANRARIQDFKSTALKLNDQFADILTSFGMSDDERLEGNGCIKLACPLCDDEITPLMFYRNAENDKGDDADSCEI